MSLMTELEPAGSHVGWVLDGFYGPDALALCELAAAICGAPAAGMRLTTADGVERRVWHGTLAPTGPFEETPCSIVISTGELLAIADLHSHERPGGGVWKVGDLRSYLGVPIRTSSGRTLGSVCVLDTEPREFSPAETHSLTTLATQVAGGLELLQLARTAAEAAEQRDAAEAQAARSVERFHALVEASPLAIFALDPLGRPDFVSDGCADLFGATGPPYDADGWIAALHEEDHDRAIRQWGDAMRSQSSMDVQYRIYDARGEVKELVVNAAAMRAASGEFRGWVGTITDVTEQVEINRALARSKRASEQARVDLEARNKELQALARARDEVLAAISHEFRTPLTSITTFLQLLAAEDGLSGSQQQALAVIARNTARLDQLVSDLLAAKQPTADIDVQLQAVDLQQAVREAVGAAILRAGEAEVELVAESNGSVWGWADPKRIAQVLDSLLDNALKFTPAGGRISVRANLDSGHPEIEVSDSGVGIASEELARVFDSFYQGAAGRSSGRGSGLGLSIVERLLEAQDATIDVQSRAGSGTTIVVALPRASEG